MPRHDKILASALLLSLLPTLAQTTAPTTQPPAARGPGRGPRTTPVYPPIGQPLADADKTELQSRLDKLTAQIATLKSSLPANLKDRLADVEIFANAVHLPLTYNELLNVQQAKAALTLGEQRASQLAAGQTPWTLTDGPRGYYSKIDGSPQPFLLTMPTTYTPANTKPLRLDIFCRGRTDSTTELAFLNSRTQWAQRPMDPSPDKFILQPFGRFCNANRFAGEVDVLEALAAVQKQYPIDHNRLVITGFSMGGASAWQFATHYPDMWAAASAGAGFTETKQFLNLRTDPVPYQKTLWHMYDSVDYAGNLFNIPMVAYAGEIDPQKQASDAMLTAMEAEGLTLERIIGPNAGHTYEPSARAKLIARLNELAAKGRNPVPNEIHFTTFTLRYNSAFWLYLDGLDQHWERARADAKIDGDTLSLKTTNVSALHLDFDELPSPWPAGSTPKLTIDGDTLQLPAVTREKALFASLLKTNGHWQLATPPANQLRKSPGLQGPIDDAFMSAFLIVRPTGTPLNDAVAKWTASEADRAIKQWHAIFRGEPQVKKDTDITDADIANNNLILFGDPSSNALLKRVADRLAIKWTPQSVTLGNQSFPATTHVPVFIYPNPLNPSKYVVINSGFTFHDHSNNDRQNSKLPDWAIVNTAEPGTPDAGVIHLPAAIKAAGFFNESWQPTP